MAAVDFPVLFNTLRTGVAQLATSTVTDYVSQATQEGQRILNELKAEINQWSKMLADGEMDIEDVKYLIEGQKELMQMRVLQQKGIAQIQLDKFKSGLTDLIINTLSTLL